MSRTTYRNQIEERPAAQIEDWIARSPVPLSIMEISARFERAGVRITMPRIAALLLELRENGRIRSTNDIRWERASGMPSLVLEDDPWDVSVAPRPQVQPATPRRGALVEHPLPAGSGAGGEPTVLAPPASPVATASPAMPASPLGGGLLLRALGPEALRKTLSEPRLQESDARALLLPQLPALLVAGDWRVTQAVGDYLDAAWLGEEEWVLLERSAAASPEVALVFACFLSRELKLEHSGRLAASGRPPQDAREKWYEELQRGVALILRLLDVLPSGSESLETAIRELHGSVVQEIEPGALLDHALRAGEGAAVRIGRSGVVTEPGVLTLERERALLGLESLDVDAELSCAAALSVEGLEALRARYRAPSPELWGLMVAGRSAEVRRILDEGDESAIRGVARRLHDLGAQDAGGEASEALHGEVARATLDAIVRAPREEDSALVYLMPRYLSPDEYGDRERARLAACGVESIAHVVVRHFQIEEDRETFEALCRVRWVRLRAGLIPHPGDAKHLGPTQRRLWLDRLIPRLLEDSDPSIRRLTHRFRKAVEQVEQEALAG
jgi:hypothetical protein